MGARHGEARATNVIAIPKRFSVHRYDALKEFNTPLPWLNQLAFRIDLMTLWKSVATYSDFPSAEGEIYVDEFNAAELLQTIEGEGIVPVEQLVSAYAAQGIKFKTVALVNKGLDPVRPMTWIDPMLASSIDNPLKKTRTDKFFNSVLKTVPFLQKELILAGLNDDEGMIASWSPPREKSREQEVLETYRQELLDMIDIRRERDRFFLADNSTSCEDSFDDFMDDPVSGGATQTGTAFFVVDTSAPFQEAARSFEKHFKRLCQRSNSVRIDRSLFDAWRGSKILPYIDLKIFAIIEGLRQGRLNAQMPTLAVAKALHGHGATPDDAKRMRKNNEPLASALMNPTSILFRAMLYELHSDKSRRVE